MGQTCGKMMEMGNMQRERMPRKLGEKGGEEDRECDWED